VQEKINAVTAGFGVARASPPAWPISTACTRARNSVARPRVGLVRRLRSDEPQRLAEELAAVRARGARLSWFHPGATVPASAAMVPCRPLIDRFVPLSSLRDLALAADVLQ